VAHFSCAKYTKTESLKNNQETMYAGIDFEKQYQAISKIKISFTSQNLNQSLHRIQ